MTNEVSKVLLQRINKLMTERYLSKKEMAERLDMEYLTFWRKLNGKRGIDVTLLKQITDVLGTSTAYLMGETDNPAPMAYFEVAAPELHKEDDVTDFAYWGEVVNNVRRLLAQGDERIISSITPLMGLAYEMLAKKATISKTVVTQIGSGNNNMIGDGNTYGGK